MFRSTRVAAICAVLVLSACGGGGDDNSQAGLTLSPSALVLELDPDQRSSSAVRARANFSASGVVYVVVEDSAGLLMHEPQVTAEEDGSYVATLTLKGLAEGQHKGRFRIRVCNTSSCARDLAPPTELPYDIIVGTPTNLTPLSKIDGIPDWETYQGNAAHNGYVPLNLNAARFNTRWRWIGTGHAEVNAVVAADGRVYVSAQGSPNGTVVKDSTLYSLKESDGTEAWSVEIPLTMAPALPTLNPPAVSAGAVYLATTGHGDTAMWSFSAVDGTQRFRTSFTTQWPRFLSPTVSGGQVYTYGGYLSGLLAFDTATGATAWFKDFGIFINDVTPTVDGQHVYAFDGQLARFQTADGSITTHSALTDSSLAASYMPAVPVLTGDGRLVIRSDANSVYYRTAAALSLIDPASSSTLWELRGVFATDPVVSGNSVFVGTGAPFARLEARDLQTGALLWTWEAPAGETALTYNLVVTDSHVFVSTDLRTHAINRATRRSEWSYRKAGSKAISANGVLYIATGTFGFSDRGLTAINLR